MRTTTTATTTTKSQVRSPKAQQIRTFLGGVVLVRGADVSQLSWGRLSCIFFCALLPTFRGGVCDYTFIIYIIPGTNCSWCNKHLVPGTLVQLLVYCKQQQQVQKVINAKEINAHNNDNNNKNTWCQVWKYEYSYIPGTWYQYVANRWCSGTLQIPYILVHISCCALVYSAWYLIPLVPRVRYSTSL